jgi:hypothetical protein
MNLSLNITTLGLPASINLEDIAINGIVVGGAVPFVGPLSFTLEDNSSLTISINKTGYTPYDVTVANVYDVDNEIVIDFAPQLLVSDPEYKKPYPGFFSFKNPCSFDVDFYYNSNIDADVFWFIDNKSKAKGKSFTLEPCNPTELQIKVEAVAYDLTTEVLPGNAGVGCGCEGENGDSVVTTYAKLWDQYFATTIEGNTVSGEVDEQSVYLGLDVASNLLIEEYRPSIVLTSDCPLNASNSCGFALGEEVHIVPTITFVEAIPLDRYTLTWEVKNNGNNVDLLQDEFPLGVDGLDVSLYFDIKKIGDYTIKATINDLECGCSYSSEYLIEGLNFLKIEQSTICDSFNIINYSTNKSVEVSISDFEGVVVSEFDLASKTKINFSITTGIYKVECKYTENNQDAVQIFIVTNFCAIEDCITTSIEEAICGTNCGCNSTLEKQLASMRLITLSNLFFEKIHSFYYLNNFYTAIEDSLISKITEAKDILAKLSEVCKRMDCNGKNTVNTKSKTKNCGCK